MDNQPMASEQSIPTTDPTPMAPTTAPPLAPKSPKLPLILLTIFALAATSAAAYFYFYPRTNTPYPAVSATPSPTPIATVDPTANWQTYINQEKGYSIKYPSNFLQLICPTEELILTNKEAGETRKGPVEMPSCERDGRYTLETKTYPDLQALQAESKYYTVVEKSITLGGLPAKQRTYTFTNIENGPFPTWYTIAQVEKDKKTYEIYFSNKDSIAIFDQILSTFEFQNYINDPAMIEQVKDSLFELDKKYGMNRDDLLIKIKKKQGNYSMGTYNLVNGGGAVWWATNKNGLWTVVEVAQEPPNCAIMKEFNFPEEVSGECIVK